MSLARMRYKCNCSVTRALPSRADHASGVRGIQVKRGPLCPAQRPLLVGPTLKQAYLRWSRNAAIWALCSRLCP